jgi:hypothetical protein
MLHPQAIPLLKEIDFLQHEKTVYDFLSTGSSGVLCAQYYQISPGHFAWRRGSVGHGKPDMVIYLSRNQAQMDHFKGFANQYGLIHTAILIPDGTADRDLVAHKMLSIITPYLPAKGFMKHGYWQPGTEAKIFLSLKDVTDNSPIDMDQV